MAKLPWYKWYPTDWRLSESRADMDLAERGLYRDLLDIHYSDGSIPADPAVLAKMLSVDPVAFAAAWVKVSLRFKPHRTNPERLVNKRAAKACKELATYRQAQSEIARIAAKERSKRQKQKQLDPEATLRLPSANPQPSESDTDTDTESEKKNTPPTPQGGSAWATRFHAWWDFYPRKAAKGDALKAYQAIVVDGKVRPEQRAELKGLPSFAERHDRLVETTMAWLGEFAGRDPTTVPYPATFLRRLDWLAAPVVALAKRGVSDAERRQERSQDNIREWLERKRAEGGSDSDRVIEVCADLS